MMQALPARNSLYGRRRVTNAIYVALSWVATGIGLFILGAILSELVWKGLGAMSLDFFIKETPGPGSPGGGLANAIIGSVFMTALATLVGTPVGILTGTYLAEFSQGSRLAPVVRFVNDILLSAPSIIIGVFVYEFLVVPMKGFNAWAGSAALAIIVIPVVVRTTEDMLRLVPGSLREAAVALGAPQWKVIVMVTYRAAIQGMLTGVMLAVARIAGETAPLIFTVVNNQFTSFNMNGEIANLPVTIFQFANSPYDNWVELAWGGAMLITLAILLLNILARVLASWSNRTP
jgi:phosphate transport system permease protein